MCPCPRSVGTRCSARSSSWASSATGWCEDGGTKSPRFGRYFPPQGSIKPRAGSAPTPPRHFIVTLNLLSPWRVSHLQELPHEGLQLRARRGAAERLGELELRPRGTPQLLQHLCGDTGVTGGDTAGVTRPRDPRHTHPHVLEGLERAEGRAAAGGLCGERNPNGSTRSPSGGVCVCPPSPDSPTSSPSARNCSSASKQTASGVGTQMGVRRHHPPRSARVGVGMIEREGNGGAGSAIYCDLHQD